MKKVILIVALIVATVFCVNAQSSGSANSQGLTTLVSESPATAQSAGEPAKPGTALLVQVIDSSPSVRAYWKKMQQAAKDIMTSAPPTASVAIVGIDAEAVKSEVFEPSRRSDAMQFVDGLKIGGRFTDLARGTDAALSLLQGANPAQSVLIFLTDGELRVPRNFRNRSTFYDLMRREFTKRTNVTVLVVNVRGTDAAANEVLPQNVKILPLKSATELPRIIEQTLSPMINDKLTVAPTPLPKPVEQSREAASNRGYWIGGIGVAASILAAVALFVWRRNRGHQTKRASYESTPENLLRPQDLEPQAPASVASEPVVLLTADGFNKKTGRRMPPSRTIIRAGETVTIGSSRFVELSLEGLKQAQTLRVGFDGKVVHVDRLRPASIGELDKVFLNQQPAPIQFKLTEEDALTVEDFNLQLTVTTEELVSTTLVGRVVSAGQDHFNSRRFAG